LRVPAKSKDLLSAAHPSAVEVQAESRSLDFARDDREEKADRVYDESERCKKMYGAQEGDVARNSAGVRRLSAGVSPAHRLAGAGATTSFLVAVAGLAFAG